MFLYMENSFLSSTDLVHLLKVYSRSTCSLKEIYILIELILFLNKLSGEIKIKVLLEDKFYPPQQRGLPVYGFHLKRAGNFVEDTI